jgi:hypothetical protein
MCSSGTLYLPIYWNLGMGLDKGQALDDDEAMRNMRHLGQSIAWLGKAIASVPDAFPIPPYDVEVRLQRGRNNSGLRLNF